MTEASERFFLSGFYGQGNLGDDLLLRATIEGIIRICPNAEFVIRNEGHVSGLEHIEGRTELTGIDRILSDQSRSKLSRLAATLLAYRRYFRGCGWLVFGGGTVFHERSSVIPLLLQLLICSLARTMGLRVVALGLGIAELKSGPARIMLRAIVSMSALFAVRDDAAFSECAKAGAAKNVKLTGDLVFTLASALVGSNKKKTIGPSWRLGLSVYPPALLDTETGQATFAALQSAVTSLIAKKWQISLLAFHDDPEKENGRQDKDILSRLIESLPASGKESVSLHVMSADTEECNKRFSEIDLHCGMRFTGHVLAAIFEVPFVGISTDNKIDAICRLFGMPVFGASALDANALADAVEHTMSQKIDKAVRNSCIVGAQQNFVEFARLLEPIRSIDSNASAMSQNSR